MRILRQPRLVTQIFIIGLLTGVSIDSIAIARAANDRSSGIVAGESTSARPPIISREEWKAKPPTPGMKPQNVVGIILHHTGMRTNPGMSLEKKMRGLQSFSQRPGQVSPTHNKPAWPDIPYHFYVDAAGQIAEGRNVRFAGDTNTSYDTQGYIQVVVEGDFEKELPNSAQLAALKDLLAWLELSWDISNDKISVHKSHAPTDCPGRNLMVVLPTLLREVAEKRRDAADLCKHTQSPICANESRSGGSRSLADQPNP
jgi:hypothetical protein